MSRDTFLDKLSEKNFSSMDSEKVNGVFARGGGGDNMCPLPLCFWSSKKPGCGRVKVKSHQSAQFAELVYITNTHGNSKFPLLTVSYQKRSSHRISVQ